MPFSKGTFTHFTGRLASIDNESSPGLRFLAGYLKAVDELDQTAVVPPLAQFLDPSATITMNNGKPSAYATLQKMFNQRIEMLSEFGHSHFPVEAYDLLHEDGSHVVICHAFSISVFRGDPKQEPIKASEVLTLFLDKAEEGKGFAGLILTKATACMDTVAVQAKAASVMSVSK